MALFSVLKTLVATTGGKVVAGGAAVGLGAVGTASAQEALRVDTDTAPPAASETAVDVEGEEILVPVPDEDDVLSDELDSELDEAELDPVADTPVSPETAASPEETESPVTVEAAEESPVSPATAESPVSPASPASPASPDETDPQAVESPATPDDADDDVESPASPASPASPESP